MPTAVERVVQSLRFRYLDQDASGRTDRALLDAFADQSDESAFAELVRRHGPLVLGVCRRILGNVQDAEDAFQATFLVLARKASSLAWRASIKNWLHGVACRVAMKARSQAIRRRQKEAQSSVAEATIDQPIAAWNELRAVLDEELQALPERYRAVLLLCYLEGKTRDEAAERLGWSVGSVKGCLERGRELLRGRLCRRGLTLSAALTAALLSQTTASAATLPALLVSNTVQSIGLFTAGSVGHAALAPSVLTLAQGALNAMMIAKLKSMGFVTLLVLLATTGVAGLYSGVGDQPIAAASVQERREPGQPPARREAENQERAQDKDGRKDEPFGLVKSIDLKVGTLTLTSLRDGDRGEHTYNLGGKDIKLSSTFGEPFKLTDLAAGMRVWLQLKDIDVTSIRVENPVVPAFLTNIDAAKRTIEARAERMNAHYNVAPDAKLTIKGKSVKLAEVPVEERVLLTLSLDKKTVLAINGGKAGPRDGERPKEGVWAKEGEPRAAFVNATIIGMDVAKNTLEVLVGRDGDVRIQTVSLAKDAKINVHFEERKTQELSLAQLVKPLQVTLVMANDGNSVSTLNVMAPVVRGAVKAIDAAGKKITILEGRDERSYDLDASAVIRVQGRDVGKLADITPGMNVALGLSVDRQRVVGVVGQITRRDGDR